MKLKNWCYTALAVFAFLLLADLLISGGAVTNWALTKVGITEFYRGLILLFLAMFYVVGEIAMSFKKTE